MALDKEHNELIGKYLSGKMEPRERTAFEAEIEADSRLRQEVNDMAGLYIGLAAVEKVDAGHIEIELLVRYQENPSELDDEAKAKIETHLKSCPNCAEEIRLCSLQQIVDPEPETRQKEGNFWSKIQELFFRPSFTFRPVYGMAAAAVILVVAVVGIRGGFDATPKVAHYQIEPGVKDIEDNNRIIIDDKAAIITLHFDPAVTQDCENCLYDFELYDPSGALRLLSKSHKFQKDFAFDLLGSYFTSEGYYSFRVYETLEDGTRELIENYPIVIHKGN